MIAVDTSVWIDLLRANFTRQVRILRQLVEEGAPVLVPSAVRMELLQGVGDDHGAALVRQRLEPYDVLDVVREDFDRAADLFRAARAAGLAVRPGMDCLVAAQCVRTGTPLLHDDADYVRLAQVSDLRLLAL